MTGTMKATVALRKRRRELRRLNASQIKIAVGTEREVEGGRTNICDGYECDRVQDGSSSRETALDEPDTGIREQHSEKRRECLGEEHRRSADLRGIQRHERSRHEREPERPDQPVGQKDGDEHGQTAKHRVDEQHGEIALPEDGVDDRDQSGVARCSHELGRRRRA